MSNRGESTYKEMNEQTSAITAAWQQVQNQHDWIENFLSNESYEQIVFVGSGSSYYQAKIMANTYSKWMNRPAQACPSSELYLFADCYLNLSKKTIVIAVSRSGESTEAIKALEYASKQPNWKICGITCNEQSSIARMATCLIAPQCKEESIVATKSFACMTYMMQAAIAFASKQPNWIEQMRLVMEGSKEIVMRADQTTKSWVSTQKSEKTIFLGMGTFQWLAWEGSLKLKEMSNTWAESFGTLEFLHGPKSMVEPGTCIIMTISERAREYELQVAKEMQEYGATVGLIVAEKGTDTSFADWCFETGFKNVCDEARTILCLPALQYYGYHTAIKWDKNPDQPRNLKHVVKI